MNVQDQIEFIEGLSSVVAAGVIADISAGKVPEYWNGMELRQLLAERFKQYTSGRSFRGKRKARYNNDVIERNLL